jgi:hypothetical protein
MTAMTAKAGSRRWIMGRGCGVIVMADWEVRCRVGSSRGYARAMVLIFLPVFFSPLQYTGSTHTWLFLEENFINNSYFG